MPLLINLRHLENKNLALKGTLDVKELDFQPLDEVIHIDKPLHYDLEVQQLDRSLLVRGTISLALRCECVRCLKEFDHDLKLQDWVCHIPLEGEEGAIIAGDCVDLTPYIREDTLLAFPQHPLCEPECSGLAVSGSGREFSGRSREEPKTASSVWAELNKLKL
jgi:uncharacterized protein